MKTIRFVTKWCVSKQNNLRRKIKSHFKTKHCVELKRNILIQNKLFYGKTICSRRERVYIVDKNFYRELEHRSAIRLLAFDAAFW